MTARGNANVETWMLFCSGGATRIDVDLHEPAERRHAAKVAHVVKDCDAAMRDAAERGCRAALAWVERRSGAATACVVSFDLPDVPAGRDVGDASGGLAFAVAAARTMHAAVPGAIAAIGEIESGLRGGPLRSVEGIEAKIEGALDRLPEGGRLVYPTGNDCEIPARFRERLNQRSIETMSVASVDEALDRLFPAVATVAPTAADVSGPQLESVPGTRRAGVGASGVEPSRTARQPRARTGLSARWLAAIGVAGTAVVAIWYGIDALRAPGSSTEQGAATVDATMPRPSPAGQRSESAGSEVAGTTFSTPDERAQEGTPEDASSREASEDRGFDAPAGSSSKEVSSDGGFD